MQKHSTKRRYPRARRDLTFRPVGGNFVLEDAGGTSPQVLNLTAALVWTYCDGRRDPDAIARAVAQENPYAADRSTVHSLLAEFAKQGILD